MKRHATIDRQTRETDIHLQINLDGKGESRVDTGIPFMDHMLTLMTAHGFMDLEVKARGDTEIDDHHTVEDLGICLGRGIREALGGKEGIVRYGEAVIPMDEALARVVMDISNRPDLFYRVVLAARTTGTFDVGLVKEFFRALVANARITMHVDLLSGEEPHHVLEAIFKAFGKALDRATSLDKRLGEHVPSTKGML